jgi:hypothetical protein
VGRSFQRLVMLLAFAGALVVPLLFAATARAAMLPACEQHDAITRMPAEWMPSAEPTFVEDACTPAEGHDGDRAKAADDLGDLKVAAMCDVRGASVIAPPRILSIADTRIEAVPNRAGDHSAQALLRPGRSSHSPAGAGVPALADHAVIDGGALVRPASSEVGPPFMPVAGGPRCGVARGIDHPPR